MDTMNFREQLELQVARKPLILPGQLELKGHYPLIEHVRDGKVIGRYSMENGICTVGKALLLNVTFYTTSQISAWYFGLIDNGGTPTLSATDTLASHSGWSENSSYSGGTRIQWVTSSTSTASITNASASQFNITSTGTIYGVFICSATTGTSGTLWSTAPFSSPVAVNNGDQLKITYTVNC